MMFPIEQVVLLVKSTQYRWKAKVVSDTTGVSASDVAEILDWFTEPDLTLGTCETESVFFHPLPSGRFTLARIIPRRDALLDCFRNTGSFYVHVMIVAPETLLQFANNPYGIARALEERQAWLPLYRRPRRLHALTLDGGGPIFQRERIERLVETYGADVLVALLQSVLDAVCTVFTCEGEPAELIEGLLSLLPVRWRPELSFSTEPRFSLQRPVRLLGGPWIAEAGRSFAEDTGLPRFSLRKLRLDNRGDGASREIFTVDRHGKTKGNVCPDVLDAWPQFIRNILHHKAFAILEDCLVSDLLYGRTPASWQKSDEYDFDLREPAIEEINRLGEQCLLHFNTATLATPGFPETVSPLPVSVSDVFGSEEQGTRSAADSRRFQTASPELSVLPEAFELSDGLSDDLSDNLPEPVLSASESVSRSIAPLTLCNERLEPELKMMTAFATRALFGDETALDSFRIRWKKLARTLSWRDRTDIREIYVGMVRTLVLRPQSVMETKEPQRSIDAMEMLDILLEDS